MLKRGPGAGAPDAGPSKPPAVWAGAPSQTTPGSPVRKLVLRLGSVRVRATIAAVLVVAAAMAAGAFGLISLLRVSMTEGVENTVRSQVDDVAALVRIGQIPAQLPAGQGGTFTQVVGPNGMVLATTPTLLASQLISGVHPGEEGTVMRTVPVLSDREGGSSDPDGPYLLLAKTLTASPKGAGGNGPVTVYVAGSLHPVVQATAVVGLALAGGCPVLVILVGVLMWIFAGRALRPVEAIRSEVADISGHDLHRRVPEPPSTDEVARLARTMNQMLDRLETSAAAQRQFVADASHELRSPLAVVEAILEVALAHPRDTAWPAVTADALDEARRLHRLVDDLLVLARAEAPASGSDTDEVDLDEIVLREARRRRATSPVIIDLHRVSAGRVRGSADQLARLVHNLIDNAQRHAASRITLELSTAGDTATLVVADDGPGIAPADRGRIFERFARLDEARNQDDGGSGLGLAIAKEIVIGHGGTIRVAEARRGARFVVQLPAVQD